jgi:two-component system sensor histidine kinase KdpD
VALGVYAVVMALVARVVAGLDEARAASLARARNARHLFELSELLLTRRTLDELGQSIVLAVQDMFGLSGAALLLSVDGQLEVTAASGVPVGEEELAHIRRGSWVPVPLSTATGHDTVHTLALVASGRPIGLLVMRGQLTDGTRRELLPTLGNHIALALETAQLHELAIRTELLEEMDRLRRSLLGAVSHDLRTPLATMKVASTTLLDPDRSLSADDTAELHSLIDLQTDRLTRLVTSLLDLTRLEAGVLKVDRSPWPVLDLVGEAVAGIRPALPDRRVDIDIPDDLPPVEVDHLLIGQVLSNLLENAHRHGPPGTAVTVSARREGEWVAISVADCGPGVPPAERESVFESFVRFDTGGRAGLGLALAKTFVEAGGGRIWVETAPGGGARFVLTVPASACGAAAGPAETA